MTTITGDLGPALLKAAIELVNEKGDTSFGLRDLAAKVGVSHPAMYRHFKDRSALFHVIAFEGFSLDGEIQKWPFENAPPNPEAQLLYLGRNHLAFALDHAAYFRIMFGAR
ncbi:MAG TPA: helix-turn-helix domain-containing protein [Oculatellaceae cyanobacterium]